MAPRKGTWASNCRPLMRRYSMPGQVQAHFLLSFLDSSWPVITLKRSRLMKVADQNSATSLGHIQAYFCKHGDPILLRQAREQNSPGGFIPSRKGLALDLQFLIAAPRTHEQRKREGCGGPRALRLWWSVGHDPKLPWESAARRNPGQGSPPVARG